MRLLDLLQVFQDQENIIVPIMFSWGEKLSFPYSHTHEDIRELGIGRIGTLWSAVTRSKLGNKMCMPTRSIMARKDRNVLPTYM